MTNETETTNEECCSGSVLNVGLERAAFEQWINADSGHERATKRGAGDSYELMQTNLYWLAWKARASVHVFNGEYICGKCGLRQSLGIKGDCEF